MDAKAVVRAEGFVACAGVRTSGRDGVPWEEFVRGCPALVVPQVPGLLRPVDPAEGWSAAEESLDRPHPGWRLALNGRQLTITGPGEVRWFEGHPLLTRDWCRSATARRGVVLVTGPFAHIDEFAAAAAAGALRLLLVAVGSTP